MTYAMLVFGRERFRVLEVEGERLGKFANEAEAQEYYNREIEPALTAYYERAKKRVEAIAALQSSIKIRYWAEIELATGGRRQPPRPIEPIDEVTVNGQVHLVAAGTSAAYVEAGISRSYPVIPLPAGVSLQDFSSWYQNSTKEIRTWAAEFIGSDGKSSIPVGEKRQDFPITDALLELNKLESQGWKIVHVSEDHGLYQGADAPDEAYLTRVRYLLHSTRA